MWQPVQKCSPRDLLVSLIRDSTLLERVRSGETVRIEQLGALDGSGRYCACLDYVGMEPVIEVEDERVDDGYGARLGIRIQVLEPSIVLAYSVDTRTGREFSARYLVCVSDEQLAEAALVSRADAGVN